MTIIVPLAPGGAKRLRAFLRLLHGNLARGGDKVGSLHDMRFVFLDNDTRLLFATKFDGDWDAYIDDFVTGIPDYLDLIDSAWEGWPGIRSPGAKDYLVQASDHGGRLVRRLSGSDGGGNPPAGASRQGGRGIPRPGWLGQRITGKQQARDGKEQITMATQTATPNKPKQDLAVEQKIQELREIFADAPEMAKTALESALPALMSQAAGAQGSETGSAGRIGIRQGTVSELTVIAPFAPGGAQRLRAVLRLLNGNFSGGRQGWHPP